MELSVSTILVHIEWSFIDRMSDLTNKILVRGWCATFQKNPGSQYQRLPRIRCKALHASGTREWKTIIQKDELKSIDDTGIYN
jgi:hypothetical protein